jgi:hypothetical protein
MKYYSETADKDLRLALEAVVRAWPAVTARKMFGCPCYQANGKLFALVVSGGIVITRPAESDRETLIKQFLAVPFQVEQSTGVKNMKTWLRVPALTRIEVDKLLPYLRQSYEAALTEG